MKALDFSFDDGYIFVIPAEEYLIEGETLGLPGHCVFGVWGSLDASMGMYILGDVFLKSFYSIYDFENRRAGLALHIYSNGAVDNSSFNWKYPIIILILLAVFIGIAYLFKRLKAA